MRIGFYHDGAGTVHAGGIAVYVRRMAIELAASNDVFLYTQRGDLVPKLVETGVNVIETPKVDRQSLSAIARLLPVGSQDLSKVLMTIWSKYSGITDHIEENTDILVTFQLLDEILLSNIVRKKSVRGFLSEIRDPGIGNSLREKFSQTDWIFANTQYLAKQINNKFNLDVDDIISTGVDTDLFTPNVEPSFHHDTESILFVGRLVESKGILDLLNAVAQMNSEPILHIVGRGNEKRLRHHAQELGIADRVVFDGEVPHTELSRYYTAADIFCLPTHADSFATVNLEAMACGTPVITTNLEGIQTYLRSGRDGLMVPPNNQEALVAALEELLLDPSYRRELGSNARSQACKFTWSKQSERMEQFFEEITSPDEATTPPPIEAQPPIVSN